MRGTITALPNFHQKGRSSIHATGVSLRSFGTYWYNQEMVYHSWYECTPFVIVSRESEFSLRPVSAKECIFCNNSNPLPHAWDRDDSGERNRFKIDTYIVHIPTIVSSRPNCDVGHLGDVGIATEEHFMGTESIVSPSCICGTGQNDNDKRTLLCGATKCQFVLGKREQYEVPVLYFETF